MSQDTINDNTTNYIINDNLINDEIMNDKINKSLQDLSHHNKKVVNIDKDYNAYPILQGREINQHDGNMTDTYNDIQVLKGFYKLSNRTNNKLLVEKSDEYKEKKNIKENIYNNVNSTNRVLEIYENSIKSKNILTQKIYVFVFFLITSLLTIILGKFKYINESLMKTIILLLAIIFGLLGFYVFYTNRTNKPTNLDKKNFLNLSDDDITQKQIDDLGWYEKRQEDLEKAQNLKNITDKLNSFASANDKLNYILDMKQKEAIENQDYNVAAYYADLIMHYKIHPAKHTDDIITLFNQINNQEQVLENNNISANLKKKLKHKIEKLKEEKKNLKHRKRNQLKHEDVLNDEIDSIQDEIDNFQKLSSDINNQLSELNYEIQDNLVLQEMIQSSASPTPTPTQ